MTSYFPDIWSNLLEIEVALADGNRHIPRRRHDMTLLRSWPTN